MRELFRRSVVRCARDAGAGFDLKATTSARVCANLDEVLARYYGNFLAVQPTFLICRAVLLVGLGALPATVTALWLTPSLLVLALAGMDGLFALFLLFLAGCAIAGATGLWSTALSNWTENRIEETNLVLMLCCGVAGGIAVLVMFEPLMGTRTLFLLALSTVSSVYSVMEMLVRRMTGPNQSD